MTNQKVYIEKKVINILHSVSGLPTEMLLVTTPLVDLPNLDSMMMLNFIVKLEKEFSIKFDMDSIDEILYNIDSLVTYLSSTGQKNMIDSVAAK